MNVLHHPCPARFDYRVLLLRERYLISIHAIDPSDQIYEFICIHPVTPPLAVSVSSPLHAHYENKPPSDFKIQPFIQEDIVEYGKDDEN